MKTDEIAMTSKIGRLLTVADLEAFPDDGNRYELIDGELFVSRAPRIPHQRVLLNLEISLSSYLRDSPIGVLVPGAGAVFSDYDAVIPDLVFVRNEAWNAIVSDDRFIAAPDLVIEILSPGKANRTRDLSAKRQLYGKYGVKEYWIVDGENRSFRIFRLQEQTLEEIATLTGADEITSPVLPGFRLSLSTIFNL